MRLTLILALTTSALLCAQDVKPLDPGVQMKIVDMLRQQDYVGLRVLLEPLLKSTPNSSELLFQWGVLNLQEKRFGDAETAFRRSLELDPSSSHAPMGLAEGLITSGRSDEALQLLQAESGKAPGRIDLRTLLGNTAVRNAKYDLAIATFNEVLSMTEPGPKQGDIYLRLGETYRRKGDSAGAITALEKAREMLPGNVVVLSTLALVLDRSGRKAEAKETYEATLKLDPNNAVVMNNLAFLMAETGADLDAALAMVQRAKQLLPGLNEISDTLGWIYLKQNNTDQAIILFKELVAREPSDSVYHFHLGMAYVQKGDREKALDELREALKYNPTAQLRERILNLTERLTAR